MKQLLIKCSVRNLLSWASLEPQCDTPVLDALWGPGRPLGPGRDGAQGSQPAFLAPPAG